MAATGTSHSLGEVLVKDGILTQAQLRQAVQAQKSTSHSIGRLLVDMGFISEPMRMSVLQKTFGFDLISLNNLKIEPLVLSLIPRAFAEKHNILPVRVEPGNTLIVALEDPSDIVAIDAIKSQVGMGIRAYIASTEELTEAVHANYAALDAAHPPRIALKAGPGRLKKLLRESILPVLYFAPLGIFIALLILYEPFQKSLYKASKFDIGLWTLLLWGFWAISLYEINGLYFQKKDEEE